MSRKLIASLLIASSALIAVPAFASSGYGPATHYNPLVGAPASQRGQSAQTIAAEEQAQSNTSYGGVHATRSESGHRATTDSTQVQGVQN